MVFDCKVASSNPATTGKKTKIKFESGPNLVLSGGGVMGANPKVG